MRLALHTSASVNPNMQFLVLDHQCGHVWREHGDWYGEIVRDMGTDQEHGKKGAGHEHAWGKWTGQVQGARAGNRGTGQGHGNRSRVKGTEKPDIQTDSHKKSIHISKWPKSDAFSGGG